MELRQEREAEDWRAEVLRNQLFRSVEIEVDAVSKALEDRNARKLLKGSDIVIDTFDNSDSRRLVQQQCRDSKIECLHVGLYADYCEVIWDGNYRVPQDVARMTLSARHEPSP